ncbi:hypothetical protein EVJ50_09660 [Synechococcus sp. RSCCF101]|uniref:hypothetical protein n=1 Tax=Synechococcus sp. RSCCF101 TaxID=2511069 RepID=UPI001247C343|nr:hypothetical protein [Synechococcus sp. RSCCF101]QEY32445.1 hypothetical protein EVJ50_09660 [Synechococcus sp. RSCCF101]
MNAAETVRSIDQARAVAAVVDLFRREFPAARANLTPWRDDPLTRRFSEEETLDLAFHFPGWSPRLQCRSLLLQLRLAAAAGAPSSAAEADEQAPRSRPRLMGVLMRGMTYDGERWRLATVGDWHPSGPHLPQPEHVERLQGLCRQLFELYPSDRLAA